MATSLWGVVALALTSQVRALTGYRAPTNAFGAGVTVYLGAEVALTESGEDAYLVIGWPGDPDSSEPSGTTTQDVATLGTNRSRDETGTIRCHASVSNGDGDVGKALTDCLAIMAAVEGVVRSAADLGLTPAQTSYLVGGVTDSEVLLDALQGSLARITFTVTYSARL